MNKYTLAVALITLPIPSVALAAPAQTQQQAPKKDGCCPEQKDGEKKGDCCKDMKSDEAKPDAGHPMTH
jgi:hypothetical protein